MTLLKQAVAAGYRPATLFRNDPPLEPLRARPDFQELLRSIETGARSARSPGGGSRELRVRTQSPGVVTGRSEVASQSRRVLKDAWFRTVPARRLWNAAWLAGCLSFAWLTFGTALDCLRSK